MTDALPLAEDTSVDYPDSILQSFSTVLHVADLGADGYGIVLDRTAFHPVDHAWPDQPADRGIMIAADGPRPIAAGLVGAISEGRLFVGEDIPVRTGTPGWIFVVIHVLTEHPPAVGEEVRIEVDAAHRAALSAGHTGCHLAALALNWALSGAWTKEAALDGLGNPNFDALAIQSSSIDDFGSVDVYRIGKSLRRKGFSVDALEDMGALGERTTARMNGWIAQGAPVRIDREDLGISARRSWVCELPEQSVTIPCGGTHVHDVSELGTAEVAFASTPVTGGVELVMTTRVRPARS